MKKLRELPLKLGIHRTYKGYHFLVASLEIAMEDEITFFSSQSAFFRLLHVGTIPTSIVLNAIYEL